MYVSVCGCVRECECVCLVMCACLCVCDLCVNVCV